MRATSFALRPRLNEEFPSWSRKKITSAERLLQIEAEKGRDMSGWCVVAVTVNAVRDLGLDVVATPSGEDKGHCEIVPTSDQPFQKKIWSRLAKKTRVAYPEPTAKDS